MIDNDRALEIAREHLNTESKTGGLITLYGYADHWVANCTYPQGHEGVGRWIKISVVDGAVQELPN